MHLISDVLTIYLYQTHPFSALFDEGWIFLGFNKIFFIFNIILILNHVWFCKCLLKLITWSKFVRRHYFWYRWGFPPLKNLEKNRSHQKHEKKAKMPVIGQEKPSSYALWTQLRLRTTLPNFVLSGQKPWTIRKKNLNRTFVHSDSLSGFWNS